MESENVDLQIQDVDTGYEKKILNSKKTENKNKFSNEGIFIARSQFISWDKIELIIYFVILSLLTFIVAVTIFYFLKKWSPNQTFQNRVISPAIQEESVSGNNTYSLGNVSFNLNNFEKISDFDKNTAEFFDKNRNQAIFISTIQTDTYLQKDFIDESNLYFKNICAQFIKNEKDCYLEISKKDIVSLESKHQIFYKHHDSSIHVYLIKLESSEKQILLLFSQDSIDLSSISNLLTSVELKH